MKKGLIVLDPGHGQYANAHTTKEGYYEGTQNYILAQHLKEEDAPGRTGAARVFGAGHAQ